MGQPYFYIIKHKPSSKYYAGCKINAQADSSTLMTETGYHTTSKIVKQLILEQGLESFEVVKVKHFSTKEETLSYETRFLVKIDAANNDRFLNRHNGSKNFVNKGGYLLSQSTKDKMSKPKSAETIKKQNSEKLIRSPEVYQKAVNSRRKNPYWNSPATCEKIRIKNIERFSSPESRKQYSDKMKEYYKDHPVSEETRAKLSVLNSGERNNMFGKTHSEATKAKMRAAWAKRKSN